MDSFAAHTTKVWTVLRYGFASAADTKATHSERRSGTWRRLHSPDALHVDMPHFVLGQSRVPASQVSYQLHPH